MSARMARRGDGDEPGREHDWPSSLDDPLGIRLRRPFQLMNDAPARKSACPLIGIRYVIAMRQENVSNAADFSSSRARCSEYLGESISQLP